MKNIHDIHLTRSTSDKIIAGVCGGIAKSLGIDSTIVRLLWALLTLISFGAGVVLYIIAGILMPRDTDVYE